MREFFEEATLWVLFGLLVVASLQDPGSSYFDAPSRAERLRSLEIRIDMLRQRIHEIECGPDGLDCVG
jgi:hypothetical protein